MVILIRPSADRSRLHELTVWLRWLVPAALLLVGPVLPPPEFQESEVVQVDGGDAIDGPLSLASMLVSRLPR